jgi:hypothetical protein
MGIELSPALVVGNVQSGADEPLLMKLPAGLAVGPRLNCQSYPGWAEFDVGNGIRPGAYATEFGVVIAFPDGARIPLAFFVHKAG